MHAKEQTLKQLLEGEKQYVVPLYQRTYAWQRSQLKTLWDDLMLQVDTITATADAPGHFLGSLVLAPTRHVVGGPSRWLVVDGQQRLTSLSLALCALRDHVRAEDSRTADRIHRQFLVNEYQEGLDQLKVLPTQDDRAAFSAVVTGDPGEATGNIGDAYRVFRELLVGVDDPDDLEDMHHLEQALVSRLDLVAITTDVDDNVHRIFQSLNNTGMQLTQGDLLRNHYFMLLGQRADDVYTHSWRPMEKTLGVGHLETLAYVDLLLNGYEKASRGDTYRLQAERIRTFETDQDAVQADIHRLADRADALAPVLAPQKMAPGPLRAALERLQRWGVEATQVVMLAALERLKGGTATEEQVVTVATLCESFLVRRMLSGRSAAGLNRILAEAARLLLTAEDPARSFHVYLSGGRRGWTTDTQLREDIQRRPFYWSGKATQRLFILRRLEESYHHKEPVNWDLATPQMEHILPQTLTAEWVSRVVDPDDETIPAEDVHAQWIHRLGNLTLTSYNPELSNAVFPVKKARYAESHFEMTRRLAGFEDWGPTEIRERADQLADQAIAIWPGPVDVKAEESDRWREVRQVLVALPEGTWTTYGDVGIVTGHHPVPLGQFLSASQLPNAWRVMSASGKISQGFRWSDGRTDDPQGVLEAEGVRFDEHGVADAARRLRPEDLAELLGMPVDGGVPAAHSSVVSPEITQTFWKRLRVVRGEQVADALADLIDFWASLGGSTNYSVEPQLALYPVLRPEDAWPFGIYPESSGTIEVPFQYMKIRTPFDDTSIREHMRGMLNQIDGVEIPAARLGLRPRFPLTVLENPKAVEILKEILRWFETTAAEAAQTGGHPL